MPITTEGIQSAYRRAHLETIADVEKAIRQFVESPIEELMAWALISQPDGWYHAYEYPSQFVLAGEEDAPCLFLLPHATGVGEYEPIIVLQPTVRVGERRYRIDIAVLQEGEKHMQARASVAVECDGHDFHEKTKEQAEADKRRDRDLQSIGWGIARFTGAEIYRDAKAAAEKARNLAYDLFSLRCAESLAAMKNTTQEPR